MSPESSLPKPRRPNQSDRPNPISRPQPLKKGGDRNNNSGGGNRPNPPRGGNRGKDDNSPSPWLNPDREPQPDPSASFVEYLRWMREPDREFKDDTKVQILQMAQKMASYEKHLQRQIDRTKLIAGQNNTFEVECPWRIRVGGHRGPEQILLPAFDALGMPYIPSATLRGVARTQAIREFMAARQISWQAAEIEIAAYFGSLEAEAENRGGKIVFLDAYPLPSKTGGLAMDIATNIWKWDNNSIEYKEPNPFLSLEKTTFLIGLRLVSGCQDSQILAKVKQWLLAGLQTGVGSQVNTGYGELILKGQTKVANEILRVQFDLEGQLIHGAKSFTDWEWNDRRDRWQMRGKAEAEVRPTAFKSMLRYWFRVFALGVLSPNLVENWEGQLFGAISPTQQLGWIKVNILSGKIVEPEPRSNRQGREDKCGELQGTLSLSYSVAVPQDENKRKAIAELLKSLTWMMFNLGGIGQGARRPCYSRQNREKAPWYRGSTFYLDSDLIEDENSFLYSPEEIGAFANIFQKRLKQFYAALQQIVPNNSIPSNIRLPLEFGSPTQQHWFEAVDRHCRIVVCAGKERNDKFYALSILHDRQFKVPNRQGELDYNGNLCGKTGKPSPVWIADQGNFQVVTVFGATVAPRSSYLQALQQKSDRGTYRTIFPLQ
jgi:CRISPR-associated protein Cmr6